MVPAVVFFDPSMTVRLYGLAMSGEDLSILMRHRGILLGLVGMALIFAAFRREAVIPAITAALISKFAFLLLVWTSTGYGPEIRQVAMFDVAAIVLLMIAGTVYISSK